MEEERGGVVKVNPPPPAMIHGKLRKVF